MIYELHFKQEFSDGPRIDRGVHNGHTFLRISCWCGRRLFGGLRGVSTKKVDHDRGRWHEVPEGIRGESRGRVSRREGPARSSSANYCGVANVGGGSKGFMSLPTASVQQVGDPRGRSRWKPFGRRSSVRAGRQTTPPEGSESHPSFFAT